MGMVTLAPSHLTLFFPSGPFIPNSDWQSLVCRHCFPEHCTILTSSALVDMLLSPAYQMVPLLLARSSPDPVQFGPWKTSGLADQASLPALDNAFIARNSDDVWLDDDIQYAQLEGLAPLNSECQEARK